MFRHRCFLLWDRQGNAGSTPTACTNEQPEKGPLWAFLPMVRQSVFAWRLVRSGYRNGTETVQKQPWSGQANGEANGQRRATRGLAAVRWRPTATRLGQRHWGNEARNGWARRNVRQNETVTIGVGRSCFEPTNRGSRKEQAVRGLAVKKSGFLLFL